MCGGWQHVLFNDFENYVMSEERVDKLTNGDV